MRSKEDLKYLFYHKNSRSEYIHKAPTQLNYSIPCINCDCLIPSTDVDSHSKICQNSSVYKYSNITEYAAIQETDLKIKKLRQSIMLQYVQEPLSQNKKYLMRSEELCNTLLSIKETDEKSTKYLQDIEEEIKLLIETYKGMLLVQLFLERLHSLCLVKLSNLRSIIKLSIKRNSQESTSSTQLSKKINNFQQNIQTEDAKEYPNKQNQQQKKSSNGYLFSAKESTQSFQGKIFRKTQITKFSSQQQMFNKDLKSEILTRISSSQCEEEYPIQDLNKEDQVSQLQRLFYSKCLNVKAKLPNSHPAQRIPLCFLHKEALNQNIPIQRWDEFIAEAYQKPEVFLDVQKLQNKQSPFQFQLSTRQILCNNNLKERIKNLKVL